MALPIGSFVMAKRPGVHFRIKNNNDVEKMPCGVIERVQKVQGEWLWLGRGWVSRRDVVPLREAAKYFTAEIVRKPTPFAYVARAAAKGRADGFTSETDNDIDSALRLDPEFASAYYLRGVALCALRDYDAAAEPFNEAIRCDSTFADVYNDFGRMWYDRATAALGRRWSGKGLAELQLQQFDRAISRSPRMARAYSNRAAVCCAAGDFERALSDAQESLKHDPRSSAAYRIIGECLLAKGDEARALAAVNQAVRLNAKCGLARLVRGEIYERQGEDKKALAELSLAVQYLPRNTEALETRARLYYRRGEIEKHRADRLAAARLEKKPADKTSDAKTCGESKSKLNSGTTDWPLITLPGAKSSQTKSTASKDASDKSKTMPAETPRSRANTFDLSARRCATSTDDRYLNGERAVEAATQACELTDWKVSDFIDTLAAAYAEAGDFDAAAKWQAKAIELGKAGSRLNAEAEKRLELYRAHKPCREDTPGRLAREPNGGSALR